MVPTASSRHEAVERTPWLVWFLFRSWRWGQQWAPKCTAGGAHPQRHAHRNAPPAVHLHRRAPPIGTTQKKRQKRWALGWIPASSSVTSNLQRPTHAKRQQTKPTTTTPHDQLLNSICYLVHMLTHPIKVSLMRQPFLWSPQWLILRSKKGASPTLSSSGFCEGCDVRRVVLRREPAQRCHRRADERTRLPGSLRGQLRRFKVSSIFWYILFIFIISILTFVLHRPKETKSKTWYSTSSLELIRHQAKSMVHFLISYSH
jgi:hypothetical protein